MVRHPRLGLQHRPDSWLVRAGKATSKEALSAVLWRSDYRDAAGNIYPARFGRYTGREGQVTDRYFRKASRAILVDDYLRTFRRKHR